MTDSLARNREPSSRRARRWLPVLMYHRVIDRVGSPDPWRVNVSTADFSAQMGYLGARGYQTISLDDVPLAASPESPWRKPVAITFDDGYRDTLTHALPILKKHRFTATIMLVSDCIGKHNAWDGGRAEPAPLLSLAEIQELRQEGMRYGSHTATHPLLPEIDSAAVRSELAGSKAKLEELLGVPIRALAYPYGRSTPEVRRIAAEVGYVAAFGVDHGSSSLLDYSRIDAARFRGDTLAWRLKLAGLHHRLRQLRRLRQLNHVRKRLVDRATRRIQPALSDT
jgi:peptidoglycan/xylan/chitin deacetylase (PgdA/CDA1 family)